MKIVKEYYPDNIIKAEGYEENGLKEGLWIFYYPNGRKNKEVHYKAGVEEGDWFKWHQNGILYIEQSKINGVSNGLWKEYYDNGKIKEIGQYINGSYTPIDFWDENGDQLLKDGNGKKIEKFGAGLVDIFEQYFENGKLIKEVRL